MRQSDLIRQAKALKPPNPFAAELAGIPCQFKIRYRCQNTPTHFEHDPTGEAKLPAPACNNCHDYVDRAFWRDIRSEEANIRIKLAILATYEALRNAAIDRNRGQ